MRVIFQVLVTIVWLCEVAFSLIYAYPAVPITCGFFVLCLLHSPIRVMRTVYVGLFVLGLCWLYGVLCAPIVGILFGLWLIAAFVHTFFLLGPGARILCALVSVLGASAFIGAPWTILSFCVTLSILSVGEYFFDV